MPLNWVCQHVLGRNLSVYTQEDTVEKYLYQSGLPEMTEFTICFWLKPDSDEVPQDQFILSLATKGKAALYKKL